MQNAACAMPILVLLLITGISATVGSYLLMTTQFHVGVRLLIPIWYGPITASLVILSAAIFFQGLRASWRNRHFMPCVIRSVIFSVVVYFSIATILTPYEVNDMMDAFDKIQKEKAEDPTRNESN